MGLATVMNDIAPVFERPQPDCVRLDEVLYGMTVQLVQQSDTGWCYVRTEYSMDSNSRITCMSLQSICPRSPSSSSCVLHMTATDL